MIEQKQASSQPKYIRICTNSAVNPSKLLWGYSLKVGSTTLHEALPQPRMYDTPRTGDHVKLVVRDPRDRLVSAWMWFTKHHNSYLPDMPEQVSKYLLDKDTPFDNWVETALQHFNLHWYPQSEMHTRWREFELIPLKDLSKHLPGCGHGKKIREDNSWEQYYSDGLLALVNEVYKGDIEMYKEATNGIDTRARRVL